MAMSAARDSSAVVEQSEGNPAMTPFRSFAARDFYRTASWTRLENILTGNGGCYGLYGPRGAGKSWLMLMAIDETGKKKGLGLWFPCPSEYDANAFLSTLSDNLANVVERRFVRNSLRTLVTRRLQLLLSLVIGVPIIVAVVAYVIHGLNNKVIAVTIFSPIPRWLWLIVGIAIALLVVLIATEIVWERQPTGQLVREAISLRERIRFTASMKLGNEVELAGGSAVVGKLRRSRERSLDERPATIASLVYDFRHLAELIVKTLRRPLVIGIDELDKIERPEAVLKLLRDIKGIFEIENVTFLVSVSEEAAAALQLGPLRTSGRNEFNSSFYTVIELPPLSPAETVGLLRSRRIEVTERRAHILCLLGAGNLREIVRLAERMEWVDKPQPPQPDNDWRLLASTLEEETAGLLREIISSSPRGQAGQAGAAVLAGAWNAFPHVAFATTEAFVSLSRTAIHDFWEPGWSDAYWKDTIQESWRRLLIRLFVAGAVLAYQARSRDAQSAEQAMITDLRDVVMMATHSSAVARLMLEARFGNDLSSRYQTPDLPDDEKGEYG